MPEANHQKSQARILSHLNQCGLYGLLRIFAGHSSSILPQSFQCVVPLKQCEEKVFQGQAGLPGGVTNSTSVVQNSRLMRYIKARVKCPSVSDATTRPLLCQSLLVNWLGS